MSTQWKEDFLSETLLFKQERFPSMFFVVDDSSKNPFNLMVAPIFVSIGNRSTAEKFHHKVLSIKWITDPTGFPFEKLSLTELRS